MAKYDMDEVIMQAKSMCKSYDTCDCCPLLPCEDYICTALCDKELAKATEKIVQWAKDNPEPSYPSWSDWQYNAFGDAIRPICPMSFGVDCPARPTPKVKNCVECRDRAIPAKVALKLGIEPIKDGREAGD